jgi:hypothetical protein
MNNKIGVIFVLVLLLSPFILNFVSSQVESPNIFGINPESGIKLTEKWEYLGKEWKTILMRNVVVQTIDSFLQKIGFIFVVALGTSYSLSLAFFLTLFLWVYLFLVLLNILGNTIFSKWVSVVISLGLAIGAAQIKLLQMPVNLIIGLFFGEKPWWIKLIIGVVIVLILVIVFVLIKTFGKKFAENKQKMEDMKNRLKLGTGAKIGEKMSSIFKKS